MSISIMKQFAQTILCTEGGSCKTPIRLPKVSAETSTLASTLKIVFGIVAILAVIYITLGGFKYVMSQGDPGNITKARNSIVYGALGLAVAVSAFAIVAFTIGKV